MVVDFVLWVLCCDKEERGEGETPKNAASSTSCGGSKRRQQVADVEGRERGKMKTFVAGTGRGRQMRR